MIAILLLFRSAYMLFFFILVVAKRGSLGVVQQLVVLLSLLGQFLEVDVQKMVLHFANGGFDVEGDALHVLVSFAHGVDGGADVVL